MPDLKMMTLFDEAAQQRLQDAINTYYDYIEANDTPGRRNVAALKANQEMQRAIRELHTQAAVLGTDGEKLSPGEKGLLRDLIIKDQEYMDGFIKDLSDLSREQAMHRTNMYVTTIRDTSNRIAVFDLPDLPITPRSMSLKCTWHCRCILRVVRLGNNSWDVYWLLDPEAEHCEDCVALADEWNPLQVRDDEVLQGKKLTPRERRILKAALLLALKTRSAEAA
jgi:hypothetical protein